MTDWEDDRLLCPDGACVGVIGPDGTCRVCGRAAPGWGDERQRGLRPPEEADAETAANAVVRAQPSAPDDWETRELCPDGSCIGVIGPEGVCTVCGRPGKGMSS